jgi:uncharacterized protein YdaU (DUF1376 family)
MSPRLAWYSWFTGDWLAQTRGWSVTARGVARELLDAQWDRGCLPVDPEELRRLISATRREWELAWSVVEPLFPVGAEGRQNLRLEEEREKAIAFVATRKRASQAGHAARWGNASALAARGRR